ncbi:MAG: site-specific DNA-methyltransferase, partial [Candidatus Thermofonsia Clade 1 bacterium]
QASSREGDIVLDPFCGCGTTIIAAQQLGRRWIGIDITHLAAAMNKWRLEDRFGSEVRYRVIGEPRDLASARQLASENRYQFQYWAVSLIKARPLGASLGEKKGKKGSDQGIDGTLDFFDDSSGKPKRVIVQAKSGKVKPSDVRDLRGVIEREEAAIGVFITLEP